VEGGEVMGMPAQFKIVDFTERSVLIRDIGPWDQCFTVTNDAENVVARILPVLGSRRLFYFDSEGDLGEIKVEHGKFAGFVRAEQVP
jgi:hypothetical protein